MSWFRAKTKPTKKTQRRAAVAAVGLIAVAGVLYVGALLGGGLSNDGQPHAEIKPAAPPVTETVEINIAYGTEKRNWLLWAAERFADTTEGAGIKVNLIGMGSVEGGKAVVDGPGKTPLHVWTPASSTYRDVFEMNWKAKYGGESPIASEANLALSPMVLLFWKDRYDALAQEQGTSIRSLGHAMQEPGGWAELADKPEWGQFKFSHTHPELSNSGLVGLVLFAYNYFDKQRGLTTEDAESPDFQRWLADFEREVLPKDERLSHSTGTLAREMVIHGPSKYDCVLVYENLAIEYIEAAEGRWGKLFVKYPERNLWNENPYYVLDVPWSSPQQQTAARKFMDFLLREDIQREALAKHGFRPGNPNVPVLGPESPLTRFAEYGLSADVGAVCERPRGAVLNALLETYAGAGREHQ